MDSANDIEGVRGHSYINSVTAEFRAQISQIVDEFRQDLSQLLSNNVNQYSQLHSTENDLFSRANDCGRQNPQNNSSGQTNIVYAKLINLPKFGGDPTDWPIFERSFEDTSKEFGYSHCRNIIRLREALQGNAKSAVQALLPYPDSVPEIMKILKQNFGRPDQIINSQIVEVRQLPNITNSNISLIVNFAKKVRNMAAFMRYANRERRLCDTLLLSELVDKLPMDKQLSWEEYKERLTTEETIGDFSTFLDILARRVNALVDKSAVSRGPSNDSVSGTTKSSRATGRRVLLATEQKKCIFCDSGCADVNACSMFGRLTSPERWAKVREMKLCFSCLKTNHPVAKCYKKKKCEENGCEKYHHKLLHTDTANTNAPTGNQIERVYSAEVCKQEKNEVLFQIVPVTVTVGQKSCETFALVDQGATHSMIEWDIAKKLGLKGKKDSLTLQWLGDTTTTSDTELVEFKISGNGKQCKPYILTNVYTVRDMKLPVQSFYLSGQHKNDAHLKHIPLENYRNAQPKIVIGLDYAHLTVALEKPIISSGPGLIAARTRLGWIVHGCIEAENTTQVERFLFSKKALAQKMKLLDEQVKSYFLNEDFGVTKINKPMLSDEEKYAVSVMQATTKRLTDRIELGLLWSPKFTAFPDSFDMAMIRLQGIEKRMARDNTFAGEYKTKVNDIIAKGYARKMTDAEAAVKTPRTFYLPHFAVRSANKRGVRIVFDAAAEVQGMSLNKALLTGPDLNQPLLVILLKFRESQFAVCGDIKEMFLQVAIRKEDQDSQRFLWRDSGQQKIDTYVMTRCIFGATCSPTLAQHAKNENARMFVNEFPRAVLGILDRHYVDDYVDCFDSERDAAEVVQQVMHIHKKGGFELRNIVSNSAIVLDACKGTSKQMDLVDIKSDVVERVLGMYWSPNEDAFLFVLNFGKVPAAILDKRRKPTKRELLSLNMSIFDPFGILANFVISSKLILQRIWILGLSWDQEILDDIYNEWCTWLDEILRTRETRVPRCYHPKFTSASHRQLHLFADASEQAMAAVAYWRIIDGNDISVQFIMAKTKCAPLKFLSIPRLELQAAVMAARLKETVLNSHTVAADDIFFWSDSMVALSWIHSTTRRFKQFVANRIAVVLEHSIPRQWQWLPSAENVADEGTRAKFPPYYEPNGRWTRGPDFLLQAREHWPTQPSIFHIDEEAGELRATFLMTKQVSLVNFDINRFSNLSRLKRCMALVLRFVHNIMPKRLRQQPLGGPCSQEELNRAEGMLCRTVQQEMFSDEIASLSEQRSVSKESALVQLNPYLDEDGMLRVNGRIENASFLAVSAKRPIILPKAHRFTRLVVMWYHVRFHHVNQHIIMNEVRQKYWVPSLRATLKSVEANCNFCRIRKAVPRQPIMAPLPVDRLTPCIRPFSYSGVDYFGPLTVSVGRKHDKRWVALFTCMVTRAVHLELATDLSSDACLICIRNFVNRRGVPVQIRSDNGKNFVGLAKELQGVNNFLDHGAIQDGLSSLGIRWKFNCPANPSEGGVWERLVKSVKKVLYIVLKESAPRVETLISVLIEVENIVNSRPLTHLPVTPDDPEPLTPNMLLMNHNNFTQTPVQEDPLNICPRKQWKIAQSLKNGFWKQWMREYLPELTRRTKWCRPTKHLSIGDLVLVCETDKARSEWRRGRVTKLYIGSDGVCRSADVETTGGLLKRPTSKLAVLDLVDNF